MRYHSFSDSNTLNEKLSSQLQLILSEAVHLRGHAYLVVSGGKTPVDLFQLLAKTPFLWEKVTILLADERCVSLQDEARNERMVKEYLIQDEAKNAQWLSLYDDKDNSLARRQALEGQIAALPTFDAVILGLGEDGHTASLFPCSEELSLALDDKAPALLVINPKTAPHQRISLSKKRLLNSRAIFLHIIGDKKRDVLDRAKVSHDPLHLPICAFLTASHLQVMYAPI